MHSLSRFATVVASLLVGMATANAQVPAGYPADYAKILDAAKKEGKVVVYSTTDAKLVTPLVKDFEAAFPGVKVEYTDMNSTEIYNRFISENAANAASADAVWSSSMDLQLKLAEDGLALTYKSPEIGALPDWAHWKDMVYATTFEPIAIVYNKRLVAADEVPKTHADLLKLLTSKGDKFQNKVTAYDPEKSGVGFMLVNQDAKYYPQFWDLVKAFGARSLKVQSSTGTMLERVSSGENLIGYNVLGSYALTRAKKDPSLGIAFTSDYNLVLSRLAFVAKNAKNPNAGKLWVDYLLSKRGQTITAEQAELYSIRTDITGKDSGVAFAKQLGGAVKPIPVSTDLLAGLDQTKRLEFLKRWQTSLGRN
ncbi:MAG TPA: ABC transporter substrate-binding protein [Casimicrobiaceae bacterium]|jgi:iron(III) transport system substrate-binding protein|nr:ABC transporter substrate-binding protein [Casimicrobiaceae bacterium]